MLESLSYSYAGRTAAETESVSVTDCGTKATHLGGQRWKLEGVATDRTPVYNLSSQESPPLVDHIRCLL
ncbi:hypothetical protein NEOLEDRAFT_1143416, partial [Neolentinus lepideus HHB14362 ss-1]